MTESVRFLFRMAIILLIPVLVSLLTYRLLTTVFLRPVDAENKTPVFFLVESGKTFRAVCKDLQAQGLVNYWWSLEILAKFQKGGPIVRAGEYELSPSMLPSEILRKLVSGDLFQRKVMFKEGTSIWEMGKIIEEAGVLTKAEWDAGAVDAALLGDAGIRAKSFEGYLFPNTYQFSRPTTPRDIIWKMLEEGEKRWPIEFTDQADKLRMTRHEVLTLASIIEKESGSPEEQPIIASVFHNRLRQGMKLQADPTVIYGIQNFNGNLTKQDLETATPYNTYTNYGLPPGPICNPGETAIKAALFPQETTYLFFVSDRKGHHVFSTTLDEHNEAVKQFQMKN